MFKALTRKPSALMAVPRRWHTGRSRKGASGGRVSSDEELEAYQARLTAIGDDYDGDMMEFIELRQHGRRKGTYNFKSSGQRRRTACSATWKATLRSQHDAVPDLGLPELAFAGRSNSGKSSLVNPICAVNPNSGLVAETSAKARRVGLGAHNPEQSWA